MKLILQRQAGTIFLLSSNLNLIIEVMVGHKGFFKQRNNFEYYMHVVEITNGTQIERLKLKDLEWNLGKTITYQHEQRKRFIPVKTMK